MCSSVALFQFEQRTRHGYVPVGDLEQCIHYKVGKLWEKVGIYNMELLTLHRLDSLTLLSIHTLSIIP